MVFFSSFLRRRGRALCVAAGLLGCSYPFERTTEVSDGEIRLTPRREDGALAERAVASVSGGARAAAVRRDAANGNDALVLAGLAAGPWLVRVQEDEDNDGVAERGAWLTQTLELLPIPKSFNDGCAGRAPPLSVNSRIWGDIVLEETASLGVEVEVDDGSGPRGLSDTEAARVVVWRDLVVEETPYATTVEASAAVVHSAATLRGLIAGTVHVAVFVYETDASAGTPLLYGVTHTELAPGSDARLTLRASIPARQSDGTPKAVDAEVELTWDPALSADASLELATTDSPDVADPLATVDVLDPQPLGLRGLQPGDAVRVRLPVGVSRLVLASATEGLVGGSALGVVMAPQDPGAPDLDAPRVGPVLLTGAIDPCAPLTPEAAPDCDNDGIADEDDEDRDGDGQADAQEGAAEGRCVAPGQGTDLDGDGLCEPAEDGVEGT